MAGGRWSNPPFGYNYGQWSSPSLGQFRYGHPMSPMYPGYNYAHRGPTFGPRNWWPGIVAPGSIRLGFDLNPYLPPMARNWNTFG